MAKKEKLTPFKPEDFLTNEEIINAYLDAEIADGDPVYIKKAIENIARAREINASKLARETGLARASVYNAISPNGNPTLDTVVKIADHMGYQLILAPKGAKVVINA